MVPVLETPRLYLRPLKLADVPAIQELFPQWEIVRYLTTRVPWPYPPDGARRFIEDVALPAMERGDAWHWTLRHRSEPSRLIGGISLMRGEQENRGFWLEPRCHGQGLMSEACRITTDYWFGTLGFPALRVQKAIANEASRRISLKQGMRIIKVEEREFVSGRLPAETWELTAAEWRAAQEASRAGRRTPDAGRDHPAGA